jgi:hypothetical protein
MEDRMPCHPDRVRRNYDEAPAWRSPSANAAAVLTHVHRYNFWSGVCECGQPGWVLRRTAAGDPVWGDDPSLTANVIEGDPH